MKRALILLLALSTLAAARDKKPKLQPGPYVFTSKASAQVLRALIVQQNIRVREGYALDSDNQFQLRFSMPAQMPLIDSMLTVSGVCKGMTTRKVWSYSLVELNGTTKITVQPVWEYPDEYCQMQPREFIWSRPEEIAAFQAMLDNAPTSSAQAPTVTPSVASTATVPPSSPTSTTDQQLSMKQHAACVELAKDNPSITCK